MLPDEMHSLKVGDGIDGKRHVRDSPTVRPVDEEGLADEQFPLDPPLAYPKSAVAALRAVVAEREEAVPFRVNPIGGIEFDLAPLHVVPLKSSFQVCGFAQIRIRSA